ncbi:type II CAAX endopeptidase family protein [uncultured Microbacterium sp.]|uniref:CPBP family intramembrane glutamic endopeptidase n=1 Tax=uncultured Microbacterium sp. TaxID=191216 RepID=UPI0028D84C71|nr:type II CAAX endopeptidase family protein [uncultured Microbacterium sp.]
MSLDSTDVNEVPRAEASDVSTRSERRAAASDSVKSTRRTDWRLGGRTVHPWRAGVLAVALIGVGLGVVLGTLVTVVLPSAGGLAATAVLWLGMLVPIVWAFTRSRPAGLLRLRFLDLLWGVGLGLILRMVQGWLAVATGGSGALPSYPSIGGSLPSGFVFSDVLAPVVIAPVLEEFFFRGVVLVSLYRLLRRPVGAVMAGAVSVVVSAGLFVMLHSLDGALSVDEVISLALLGVVCGALVMLTGRIWPAVLTHVVYNGSFVVLAVAGTLLG